MIKTILSIRFLQLVRFLNEIGIIRLIVLLSILAYVVTLLFNAIRQSQNVLLIPAAYTLVLLIIHITRKDRIFLLIAFKTIYPVYLIEYITVSLPFIFLSVFLYQWISLGILLVICLIIPLISIQMEMRFLTMWFKTLLNPVGSMAGFALNLKIPFVNPIDFEWISGIRRNILILLPIYLTVVVFSFRPYVAPVGLIVISVFISGFYSFGESRELIEIYASTVRGFMARKIISNLKYLFVLFAPVVIISLFCQPATWYFILGAIIISGFIQILAIIFKYALFEEHADLSRNSIILILNIIFIVIPLFWPVPVLMGLRYYTKAQIKLKTYLHAINQTVKC